MINPINKILDSYTDVTLEYDLSTLIEQIRPFKEKINVRNAQGETPIMHYCSKNLGSGVNNLILHMLITQFGADVNIQDNHDQIPLSLFVIPEEFSMDIDNIKLLLKYTNSENLLKRNNNLSIVQRMLISPILYNQGIVSQVLENQLLWDWDYEHESMTKQILVILEILQSEAHIAIILDVIKKRTNTKYINEEIFLHYLNIRNMLVVKELLEYDVDFTSRQAIIRIRQNKAIRQLLQGTFLTFKNNIIILDQLTRLTLCFA